MPCRYTQKQVHLNLIMVIILKFYLKENQLNLRTVKFLWQLKNKTKHGHFNAAIINSLENGIILFQRIMKT